MTNDYEARQEARRERLTERAEKARAESAGAFQRSQALTAGIPMGQPILVGHHSERKHRKAIDRSNRAMRTAVDAADKVKDLERQAAGVGTAGISSDDPEAIAKLRAEFAETEALREAEKKANADLRREETAAKKRGEVTGPAEHRRWIDALDTTEAVRTHLHSHARAFPWLPQFGPGTGQKIARIEARIADLTRRDETPVAPLPSAPGITAVEDVEANRILLTLAEKPTPERIALLKRSGWKWAPSRGAWSRMRNNAARYSAEQIIKSFR